MRLAIALFLVLTPLAVAAQPVAPDVEFETVTSEAFRTPLGREMLGFVRNHARPATFSNKIPRWRQRICLDIQGFVPWLLTDMTARVREIAQKAGAPLDTNAKCRPNVRIYFSREPQALLDQLVQRDPRTLGFHDVSQARTLSTLRYPIQAWYAAATRDNDGRVSLDVANNFETQNCGRGLTELFMGGAGAPPQPRLATTILKSCSYAWSGLRVNDGLSSELGLVTIIGDSGELGPYHTDTLADYVAMLALSQTAAFDTCQPFPSITNLLAPGCAAELKTKAMSEIDHAYLDALYRTDPGLSLEVRQIAIARRMEQILTGER
jgi:hypothetical protein